MTDAIAGAGLPEGEHRFGSQTMEIKGNRAVIKGTQTLCGRFVYSGGIGQWSFNNLRTSDKFLAPKMYETCRKKRNFSEKTVQKLYNCKILTQKRYSSWYCCTLKNVILQVTGNFCRLKNFIWRFIIIVSYQREISIKPTWVKLI